MSMSTAKQTFPDFSVVRSTDVAVHSPEPGLLRRVGAYNDKLFLVEHQMQKGWVGTRHQHPHEQIVFVVIGQLSITIGKENCVVGAGDSFVVRGGIEHQATALEDSVVVDVFTPCRYDYL
jgi:quercetin dioxygenase-like cupin family protein